MLYPHIIGLTIEGATNMTRKHFQKLVEIIVNNNLDEKTINDIMSLCKRSNRNFCKVMFMDRIEKLKQS